MKCPHVGCKSIINGMTGLQEIERLMTHYKRKHKKYVDMRTALEIRSMAEAIEDR